MADGLPDITLSAPVVVPPKGGGTFPGGWIQRGLNEGSPDGAYRVYREVKPYNPDTHQCSPADSPDVRVLNIPDVFRLITDMTYMPAITAATRVLIGQAIGADIAATNAVLADLDAAAAAAVEAASNASEPTPEG